MANKATFPSTEWFQSLAGRMHENEATYRALGPVDCVMVVKVDVPTGTELYEIVFEVFRVKSVRPLARLDDAAPTHFVLEASLDTWREMIENIREHGSADLEHTLNYLTFPDDPMLVDGPDQLEIDAFYRYNQSLQRFFDGAAAVETSFPR